MSTRTGTCSVLAVVAAALLWSDAARGQPSGEEQKKTGQRRTTGSGSYDFRLHSPSESAASGANRSEPGQRNSSDELGRNNAAGKHTPVELNYELAGPYDLRSADPEHPGEVVLKNIFGWSTAKGSGDDDFEYEFEIEWGIVKNHEFIFAVPAQLGDGRVDGNGDIELGYHWRLWEEKDWLPAFGMRNFVRIPTGDRSSGVDYEWIGLITKSIVPRELRFNVNPFVKSVNGDNTEDARHFQWGASTGLDWRVRDDLILVGLYRYESGEIEGTRDNHSLQFGADWTIVEHHRLGLGTEIGLDGDSNGPAFGVTISYMFSF